MQVQRFLHLIPMHMLRVFSIKTSGEGGGGGEGESRITPPRLHVLEDLFRAGIKLLGLGVDLVHVLRFLA